MESKRQKTTEEWVEEALAAIDAANDDAILAAALKHQGPTTLKQRLMVDEILLRHSDPNAGMSYTQRTWLGRILFDYGPIAWITRGVGSLLDR